MTLGLATRFFVLVGMGLLLAACNTDDTIADGPAGGAGTGGTAGSGGAQPDAPSDTPPSPHTLVCGAIQRDPSFEAAATSARGYNGQAPALWGASDSDLYASVGDGLGSTILHWDGSHWTVDATLQDLQVHSIWGAGPDDVWAVGEHADYLDGAGVFRRRNGTWTEVPAPDLGAGSTYYDIDGLTGSDVLLVGWASSARAFRLSDGAWIETSLQPSFTTAFYGLWRLGDSSIIAYGGGIDGDVLRGVITRFDGTTWTPMPVAPELSDVVAMAGTSLDDAFVIGRNRNDGGTEGIYHVANALQDWTLLSESDVIDFNRVWSPFPGSIVATGCEWPDHLQTPFGCERYMLGDANGLGTLQPIDTSATGGRASWWDRTTNTLHLLTGSNSGLEGITLQHFTLACE